MPHDNDPDTEIADYATAAFVVSMIVLAASYGLNALVRSFL